MLIVMKADATEGQVQAVVRVIEELGYRAHPMPGASRTAIGITDNPGAVDPSHFENLPGVSEAVRGGLGGGAAADNRIENLNLWPSQGSPIPLPEPWTCRANDVGHLEGWPRHDCGSSVAAVTVCPGTDS